MSIKELFTLIGNNFIQKKLLWTNPSPSSDFATQTISVDLSNYKQIEVIMRVRSNNLTTTSNIIDVNAGGNGQNICAFGGKFANRVYNITSNKQGILFNPAYATNTYGSDVPDNAWCIPYKIYGIKNIQNV